MLELLTSSGTSLVLNPDTRLRLSIPYPIAVDTTDSIPASVSYAFDLPDDDGGINRANIKYSPLVDEARKINRVPIRIQFAGMQIDSGFIICTGYSDKQFRCTIVCAPFNSDLGETTLDKLAEFMHPIALGTTSSEIAANAVLRNTQAYPQTPLVFPTIYAPDFYSGANDEFNGFLNRYKDNTIPINAIVKQFEIGDPEEGDYLTNEDSLYPMFFAPWLLQAIFESNGYKVYGEIFTDTFFRRLLIGAKKAADKGRYECHLTGTRIGHYDDLANLRHINFVATGHGADMVIHATQHYNIQVIGVGYYEVTYTGKFTYQTGVRNLLIEVVYGEAILFSQWFNGISENETEQTITCSFWISDPGYISVACNQNWAPVSGSVSVKGTSQEILNRYDGAIKPGEYFPDTTAANMLNMFKMLTGIGIFYDKVSRVVEVITAESVLASNKHLDITEWISSLEREQEEPVGLVIDYKRKGDKLPYINSLAKHYVNPFNLPTAKANGEAVVENMLSVIRATDFDGLLVWKPAGTTMNKVTLQGRTYDEHSPEVEPMIGIYSEEKKIVTPYYPENGASTHFSATSDMPLLCLLWHGLQAGKDGTIYPYASASGKSPAGSTLTTFDLSMDNPTGVYNRYLRGLMDLKQNNATVKVRLMLDLDRFLRLLSLFKPTVVGEESPARKVAISSVEMLPKSLDVELSLNGIEASELVLTQQVYS